MLVVITIIGILATLAIPNITKAMNKAKESQCKANLHIVQEALERYNSDKGQYPAYIAGGNNGAWMIFHQKARDGAIDPNLEFLIDPLIDAGYISIYPQNPFVDHEEGINFISATGFPGVSDLGDPRWGDQGDTMGNALDDPRFWDNARNPGEYNLHFYNSRGIGTLGAKVDYAFGGMLSGGRPTKFIWPGEFFYRAVGDFDLQISNIPPSVTEVDVWNLRIGRYESFIMGVYGADQTKGMDVVRLTGQGNYVRNINKNFPYDVHLALPEVMGGGNSTKLPEYPYKNDTGNWIFGAPDGIDDGIIYVTSGTGWTQSR
jgi:type II secretory pathway pseudopilin PulG